MAENSDINIKVGAEANLSGATEQIINEFSTVEKRLIRIGTEEAKRLAEQLRSAAEGLSSGAINPADVESVAQAMASITKDADLSDKAIGDLASKLSSAKDNSRALADWMAKTSKDGNAIRKAISGLSSWIDKMSPASAKIANSVGAFAQKIPGVSSLLTKMPGVAGAIGVAFKAVTAAIIGTISAIKEHQAAVRDFMERNRGHRAQDAQNAQANANAERDLRDRKRREELEDAEALLDIEHEMEKARERERHYETQMQTPYAREREMNEISFNERMMRMDAERARARIEASKVAKDQEIQSKDEEKKTLDERIAAEQKMLDEMTKLRDRYEADRSRKQKRAEEDAKAEAAALGLTEGSDQYNAFMEENKKSWDERAMNWLDDSARDLKNSIMSKFGLKELNPEQAEEYYKKYQDEVRGKEQELKQLTQQRTGLDADSEKLKRERERLDKAQILADEQEKRRQEGWSAEQKAKKDAITESLAGRRAELMASGNRLTALGLGGGNTGIDSGKKIAQDTGEIKDILKSYTRAALADGKSQIANGTTWAGANPPVWNY